MFSFRLYIRILLQVIAIVLVAGLGVAGIVTGRAVILGIVALFIAAWLISVLVYYLNASNRRIQLFLDAIEDDESMLYFPEEIGSREQQRLHAAFNRIHKLMSENKRKEFDRELHRKEYESWDKLMRVLTHEIMNSIAPIVSLSGTLLSYFRTQEAAKSGEERRRDQCCDHPQDHPRAEHHQEPGAEPDPLHRVVPAVCLPEATRTKAFPARSPAG